MRQTTTAAVLRYHPTWSAYEANRRIGGYLVATDLQNGQVMGYTETITNLFQINEYTLQHILDSIQSRDEVALEEIEWRFTIDPNTLYLGASQTVKRPAYADTRSFTATWKAHGVNCAAFAITYALELNKDRSLATLIRKAKTLQAKLKWGEYVSINEVMGDFITLHPDHRITIVIPSISTTSNYLQGPDFEHQNFDNPPNSEIYKKQTRKCIYLIYDAAQRHYACTTYPHRIFAKFRNNSNIRHCIPCNVIFTTQGHDCSRSNVSANARKRKAPKLHECEICKKQVYNYHNCLETKCRTCPITYKKDQHENHRCVIYEEDHEKRFSLVDDGTFF
jgi:hypothetical protein